MLTAQITKVAIGVLEIDGLLLSNKKFAVALPQLQDLNLIPPNRSQKQLEALLGIAFQSHQKAKTELHPKAVNTVGLEDVTRIIVVRANQGIKEAIALRDTLIGLSLTQLFNDAFGIKFEQEERQQWLIQRQTHRTNFHPIYTSWLQKDGITNTYGTEVNRLKLALELPLIFVGDYSAEQLVKLNIGEGSYDSLRKAGLSHSKALEILAI